MRRFMMLVTAILTSLLIAACGSSGTSANPPTDVVAVPGDGIVTLTWTMGSNVDYWIFYANSASISSTNWTSIAGSRSAIGATSPFVATGLANGLMYSFAINGRTNGGPGGPSSAPVSAIPRLAGTASASLPAPWAAGVALGVNDLRGVAHGAVFTGVGANGAIYSSPDGIIWTPSNSGTAANLNAATFRSVYLAAGDGGKMLSSPDAITWSPQQTGTTNNLYAVSTNAGQFVAVGAKGTIVSSVDGITWTAAANSATTNDLYAAAYGNGRWVAVGANGTLVTSSDASTWTAVNSNTALDLKGIAFGASTVTAAVLFVAVGANGALITSPDAATWTAQPAIGPNTLSAVVYGTQFIAVGANGSIFTSTDGMTWTSQPSTTTSNLYAIVHAPYSYSVVGAAGTNLLAR